MHPAGVAGCGDDCFATRAGMGNIPDAKTSAWVPNCAAAVGRLGKPPHRRLEQRHRPTLPPHQPGAGTGKKARQNGSSPTSHAEAGMGLHGAGLGPCAPSRLAGLGSRKEKPFFLIWCLIVKGWGFSKPPFRLRVK